MRKKAERGLEGVRDATHRGYLFLAIQCQVSLQYPVPMHSFLASWLLPLYSLPATKQANPEVAILGQKGQAS